MNKDDLFELDFLLEFFKTPRSMCDRNKELLKRLKQLTTMKLQLEITNKLTNTEK